MAGHACGISGLKERIMGRSVLFATTLAFTLPIHADTDPYGVACTPLPNLNGVSRSIPNAPADRSLKNCGSVPPTLGFRGGSIHYPGLRPVTLACLNAIRKEYA
jgi:hypothetical protein